MSLNANYTAVKQSQAKQKNCLPVSHSPPFLYLPYFFQLNPRGLVFLEGLKSGLYWNEGYIRMRVAVY